MAKRVLSTYWRSSCSYRVRIALGYKGLDYESEFVDILAGHQLAAGYRDVNPIGHVPTLTIDGVAFGESVAILELLEELHPEPPLLPKAPVARARVRALVETINAGIQPLQNMAVLKHLGEDKEVRAAWLVHWVTRGLTAFEALLERGEKDGVAGPFAFGPTFSMADCCLVPQVYAARRFGVELGAFPRVARAEKAALELPFVLAAAPEAQADAKL